MIRPRLSLVPLLLFAASAAAAAAPTHGPRVAIETTVGRIVVEMASKQAPITSANFLAYVDQKKFDGTTFYRAARANWDPKVGFVQGGIRHNAMRMLPPIKHEPTTRTGLHHDDGAISIARDAPGTATGDFFIVVGEGPSLDAHPGEKGDDQGYAVFGHVVAGMDVVKKILALPTVQQRGSGAMKNQMLVKPIWINSARRLP